MKKKTTLKKNQPLHFWDGTYILKTISSISPSEEKPKEKANYEPSGKLAAESNMFKGVVLKYAEPPEARKPTQKWRVYVFKGKEQVGQDLLRCHGFFFSFFCFFLAERLGSLNRNLAYSPAERFLDWA